MTSCHARTQIPSNILYGLESPLYAPELARQSGADRRDTAHHRVGHRRHHGDLYRGIRDAARARAVSHPDRLVNVWAKIQGHRNFASLADLADWRLRSTLFEELETAGPDNFNIATQDKHEYLEGMEATPGYNAMLGNRLFLDRNFLPEEGEPGKEHVVILTHRLWLHFGGNPRILGQPMQINGEFYTVVGVLAAGAADRWGPESMVPLVLTPAQLNERVPLLGRNGTAQARRQHPPGAGRDGRDLRSRGRIFPKPIRTGRGCGAVQEQLPSQRDETSSVAPARRSGILASTCVPECRQFAAGQKHETSEGGSDSRRFGR